jgi:hypothetical protein
MRRLGQATTWLHATLSAWPTAGWAVGSWVTARSSALTCGCSEPSCPLVPAGSRCGTDQGKPGRGEHASRHGGSRPPDLLRGLAGGQPLHHPELGPLPPFDLQALGLHRQQRVP